MYNKLYDYVSICINILYTYIKSQPKRRSLNRANPENIKERAKVLLNIPMLIFLQNRKCTGTIKINILI